MSLAVTIFLLCIISSPCCDALLPKHRGLAATATASTALRSTSDSTSNAGFKLLVLGGTGFVGREMIRKARQKGISVVSLSRRGKLVGETDESVTWVSGDASQAKTVQAIVDDFGPFDGCIHAVGLLLDAESGLSALNRYASGSGSSPTSESTYDRVTRQTGKATSFLVIVIAYLSTDAIFTYGISFCCYRQLIQ